MIDERSEGQIGADALEDRVRRATDDLNELGDMVAKMGVLLDRVVSLQEDLTKRLEAVERQDKPDEP